MSERFDGTKIAVLWGDRILSLLRDDREGLPHAGMWELPGGGREGVESAARCALRELREETALELAPDRLIWRRSYRAGEDGRGRVIYFAAEVAADEAGLARLGNEGQALEWMPLEIFLAHPGAIGVMKARVGHYLAVRDDLLRRT